jgi:hypothetical protein
MREKYCWLVAHKPNEHGVCFRPAVFFSQTKLLPITNQQYFFAHNKSTSVMNINHQQLNRAWVHLSTNPSQFDGFHFNLVPLRRGFFYKKDQEGLDKQDTDM